MLKDKSLKQEQEDAFEKKIEAEWNEKLSRMERNNDHSIKFMSMKHGFGESNRRR